MGAGRRDLLDELGHVLQDDPVWAVRVAELRAGRRRLHLAVLVEPYLSKLLRGEKTVESRFSRRRIVPYEEARAGDVVLLKRSGGPIVALAEVAEVEFFRLDPPTLELIRRAYAMALGATDPSFWESRKAARYATLLRLAAVRPLPSLSYPKRDRRGWVVLSGRCSST